MTDAAHRAGVPVFVLDTIGEIGAPAFFDAVRSTCPLDPPLMFAGGRYVWDALSDSLSGGIQLLDSDRVVIVWKVASGFREQEATDYSIALAVLNDVVEKLADPSATLGKPTELIVYVEAS